MKKHIAECLARECLFYCALDHRQLRVSKNKYEKILIGVDSWYLVPAHSGTRANIFASIRRECLQY